MVITIQIGSETRADTDISEAWVNQQINRRRKDGVGVCVIISVKEPGVDVTLATPACGSRGGGGGRPPNPTESRIFEIWMKLQLNTPDFSGGNVVAFLKQVERL